MNRHTSVATLFLACFLSCWAPLGASGTTIFIEDFEHGLGQWTGKFGGNHSGNIVVDPLGSDRGHVLTFTSLKKAGDIFTQSAFITSGPVTIEFDYLGLEGLGGVTGDLGGFIGLSPGLNDGLWIAGTSTLYYPDMLQLVDDGKWHAVSVTVQPPYGSYHLMLEDWLESGGRAGDIYFDNVRVLVPEPSAALQLILGAVCLGSVVLIRKKRRTRVAVHGVGAPGW